MYESGRGKSSSPSAERSEDALSTTVTPRSARPCWLVRAMDSRQRRSCIPEFQLTMMISRTGLMADRQGLSRAEPDIDDGDGQEDHPHVIVFFEIGIGPVGDEKAHRTGQDRQHAEAESVSLADDPQAVDDDPAHPGRIDE